MTTADRANFDALNVSLIGVTLAQLAIGVLGVLVISNEYTSGTIRATLGAVPKRLPVLWAKAAVFSVVTFLLMLPASLITFLTTQALLRGHAVNGHDITLSLSDPGVARAVTGSAVYLTLVGLLALGLGATLRRTAGGISAFVAVFFVLAPLVSVLPTSWQNAISPYLPANAGDAIMEAGPHPHTLEPWTGLGVLAAYTAAALATAAIQLRRRDA
jgi:ABC-type transport system involved in multi-copper enzyme maturation permease subunit